MKRQRPVFRALLAGFLAALSVAALGSVPAAAADHRYEEAVVATRGLVREALNGSRDRIPDAIRTLEDGTGGSQPEILADLRANPPRLHDADLRLTALEAALNRPGDAGDPGRARLEVSRILSLPRYDSIRGGMSLWDRLLAWLLQVGATVLLFLIGNTHLTPGLLYALVGALALIVFGGLYLVLRAGWQRSAPAAEAGPEANRIAIANRFAAADRLAAAGARTPALRELVAAVAGEVGNRPFWETSPLTVRELFAGQGLLESLHPLLAPFEASVYGHREVTEAEFEAALRAALPFRSKLVPESAAEAAA